MIFAWMTCWANPLVGLPIASVSLEAPRGGLPNESLQTLLRAEQGLPYNLQTTRHDLTTLLRVGDFGAVEADAEPWVIYDERGEPQPAVQLVYRVTPAPRVVKLRVQGNNAFSVGKLLDAAGITTGQTFYPDLDSPVAASRVQAWMRQQGWVGAKVEVDAIPLTEDTYELWIRVAEGQPNLLRSMRFIGDIPPEVGEHTLRRWARESGVKVGKPIASEAIDAASYSMRSHLGRVTGGLLSPRRGWIGARIHWTVQRSDTGDVDLTWTVEPGPRLDIAVHGLKYRPNRKVRDALNIDERLRLTRGFIEEAGPRLETSLKRKGFHEAKVVVELRKGVRRQTLFVEVDRGERHSLRGQPPRRSLSYEGNTAVSSRELTRAADQASPDVIRLDRFTEEELKRGLKAMKNIYASRGYQNASLVLKELRTHGRRLIPVIHIEEGPRSTLTGIEVTGAAPDVPVDDLIDPLEAGTPYNPNVVEHIGRAVLIRHREAGYLRATVAISHLAGENEEVMSTINITPGPVVLLRSIAIRGSRHTQPWFIRRELALERGAPLTTLDLERARRALYGLGIFRSVGIDLLGDGVARDLLITVDERARWGTEAGFGLNTDQGARVFARAIRRNLFGIGHRLDAHGLFGISWASQSLADWSADLSSVQWRMAIRYTAPHFPARTSELVLDVLLQERNQERTWRMARTGAGVTLNTKIGRYTRFTTALRFALRDLQQYDPRALLDGEPWKVLDQAGTTGGCSPCRLAESLQVVLVHDQRNDPIQPTRGVFGSAIIEFAPGVPWQKPELRSRFLKSNLRVAGFVPLGKLRLQLSAEGGHARELTGGVVPLEDRFRLGGTGSMRGFSLQSVGPRNRAASVAVTWPAAIAPVLELTEQNATDRWIPTGGDTQAIGIAELIVPLEALGFGSWDGYALAAFTDIGNVWHLGPGAPTSNTTPGAPLLRSSTGLGLRVSTPIGPLQLDVASNNQRMFSKGAMKALLTEAWEEPALRAHLSLGTLW